MSVIVSKVEKGSPAYKRGLKAGDTLISIDGMILWMCLITVFIRITVSLHLNI